MSKSVQQASYIINLKINNIRPAFFIQVWILVQPELLKDEFRHCFNRMLNWTGYLILDLWHSLLVDYGILLTSILRKHHSLEPIDISLCFTLHLNLFFRQIFTNTLIYIVYTSMWNLQTLSNSCAILNVTKFTIHILQVLRSILSVSY